MGPPRGGVAAFGHHGLAAIFFPPCRPPLPPLRGGCVLVIAPPAVAGALFIFAFTWCGKAAQPHRRPKIWGLHGGVLGCCSFGTSQHHPPRSVSRSRLFSSSIHTAGALRLPSARMPAAATPSAPRGSRAVVWYTCPRRLGHATHSGGSYAGVTAHHQNSNKPGKPPAHSVTAASPAPRLVAQLAVVQARAGCCSASTRCTRPWLALGGHFGGGGCPLRGLRTPSLHAVACRSVACVERPTQGRY